MTKPDEPLFKDHSGVLARDLITAASDNPRGASAKVLADWCIQRGLGDAGEAILLGDGGPRTMRAIAFLRGLLGTGSEDRDEPSIAGRYVYPIGFPSTILPTQGISATVATALYVALRVRKIVIPRTIQDALLITDVKNGKNSMIGAAAPIPGSLFDLFGPDLFDEDADVTQYISINVTNISDRTIMFNGCVLGISQHAAAPRTWQLENLAEKENVLLLERKLEEQNRKIEDLRSSLDRANATLLQLATSLATR